MKKKKPKKTLLWFSVQCIFEHDTPLAPPGMAMYELARDLPGGNSPPRKTGTWWQVREGIAGNDDLSAAVRERARQCLTLLPPEAETK